MGYSIRRERRKGLWERLTEQGLFKQTENGVKQEEAPGSVFQAEGAKALWLLERFCRFKEAKEAGSIADQRSVQMHEHDIVLTFSEAIDALYHE